MKTFAIKGTLTRKLVTRNHGCNSSYHNINISYKTRIGTIIASQSLSVYGTHNS